MVKGYRISSILSDMDIDVIHNFIANSYWAKDIPLAILVKSMQNSMCFVVLDDKHQTVGFARMITDKATFAYLADVFVLPAHEGKGLANMLLTHIMADHDLQGLRKMMLTTSDAQGLYANFGFSTLASPVKCMEKSLPNVYSVL
jgi:N-acetylglutamate synthase-like GNAT family acetyltransferase